MNYYSPSYKRAEGVKTHKILPSVIYCVHEFEAKEYQDKGYKIEILPDSIKGNIARVRNYIKTNLIKGKGLIIDDDIEALKRWVVIDGQFKAINIENIDEFFEMAFIMLKEMGATLFGVNILGDKGSYREYSPISLTNTVSGSLMGFLNNDLSFDESIPLKEDYDFCLQTLNKYRKLLRFNNVHMVKKDHGNMGGCADYRTLEIEKEQLKLFQEKWGSKIVKYDEVQRGDKIKGFDINPVVKIPIKGI